ncbi:MAG: glycosyltransferase family 4 protein [Minisyncoccia bacterium]
MRIITFTPFWLQTKGGITTIVEFLSEYLRKLKNDVFVITWDNGAGAIKLPRNKLLFILSAIWNFKKIDPDVIHVHASGCFLLPAVIYKTCFSKETKIIFTFHTNPQINLSTKKSIRERGVLSELFFNLLLKKCDAVSCVSEYILKSLRKPIIENINPVIIYNGTEKREFDSKSIKDFRNKYGIESEFPILCMVGVFSWDWKIEGIKILIQSFKKTTITLPSAKLLIVGEGKYRSFLEGLIRQLSLEGKVILTGKMENPFVALSVCDIYCHISLNESFGLSVLEAMISRKPVIASNDGGIPEIITQGYDGLLVKSDPECVSSAILTLAGNADLRKELVDNAIMTVEARFSWDKITKEYLKLYQK